MNPDELKALEVKFIMASNAAKIVSARMGSLRAKMKTQMESVRALAREIKIHRSKTTDDSSYQIINQCVSTTTSGSESCL